MPKEKYAVCMKRGFLSNLHNLWLSCIWLVVFSLVSSFLFPSNFVEGGLDLVYFSLAVVSASFAIYFYKEDKKIKAGASFNTGSIYLFIFLVYSLYVYAGVYSGITNPHNMISGSINVLIICGIILILAPVIFNFFMIIGAATIYLVFSYLTKSQLLFLTDLNNMLYAVPAAFFFNWFVNASKMRRVCAEIDLEKERDRYQVQSTICALTGLKNRRYFDRSLSRYLQNYRAEDKYIYLAILDIDYFKNYNDHYGHPEGDKCLRQIGWMLDRMQAQNELHVSRFGGEEFAILWFSGHQKNAKEIAESLLENVKNLKIPHSNSEISEYVTISAGIFTAPCGKYSIPEDFYKLADSALYTAKASGRNCVVLTDHEGNEEIFRG